MGEVHMKNKEQTRKKMLTIFTVTIVVMIGVISSCGCVEKSENIIKVSGAYSLYPMMVVWAQEYQKLHPDVRIDITTGGAGKGMSDALAGSVNLGMVSRDITVDEASQGIIGVAVV
jgi:phosphate transport system substrate-binding protein